MSHHLMTNSNVKTSRFKQIKNFVEKDTPIDPERYFKLKLEYVLKTNTTKKLIMSYIEIFYVAKRRQEIFRSPKVHALILANLGEIMKTDGFSTTLFIIIGKCCLKEHRPPFVMAKMLYEDLKGKREFSNFPKAKEFIERVI